MGYRIGLGGDHNFKTSYLIEIFLKILNYIKNYWKKKHFTVPVGMMLKVTFAAVITFSEPSLLPYS